MVTGYIVRNITLIALILDLNDWMPQQTDKWLTKKLNTLSNDWLTGIYSPSLSLPSLVVTFTSLHPSIQTHNPPHSHPLILIPFIVSFHPPLFLPLPIRACFFASLPSVASTCSSIHYLLKERGLRDCEKVAGYFLTWVAGKLSVCVCVYECFFFYQSHFKS